MGPIAYLSYYEFNIRELPGDQELPKVVFQGALWVGRELEAVHLGAPHIVVHSPSEYQHGVPYYRSRMEQSAWWTLWYI